jgi:hypothetical protein
MIAQIALAVFVPSLLIQPASTQAKRAKYPLTKFDNYGCMAKGRVQDCRGKVMQQILSEGKDAIPILISQLTETAVAENQIADYWSGTRSGDSKCRACRIGLLSRKDATARQRPAGTNTFASTAGCRSDKDGSVPGIYTKSRFIGTLRRNAFECPRIKTDNFCYRT